MFYDKFVQKLNAKMHDLWIFQSMSAKSGEKFKAKIYQPDEPEVDASLFVIFLIAVICYAIGGFWSGHYRNQM